jgi:hypothetical protein
MSWLTVYMIVSTPVAVLSLRRARDRVPDRHIPIVIFGWLIAQIPLLCAMAALFDHAPQWFGAVGFFEAILLMNYATRSERRARSQLSP